MAIQKTRWGLSLFIFAIASLIGTILLINSLAPFRHPQLYDRILPITGMILSLLVIGTGHFSYPRIHSLRIYLAAFLIGITGMAFFGPALLSSGHSTASGIQLRFLYWLIFVNGLIVPLVPPSLKYRLTQQLTFVIVFVESTLILIARFAPFAHQLMRFLDPGNGPDLLPWTGILWALVVIVLTLRFVSREFHLGGVLAGTALLYSAGLVIPLFTGNASLVETLIFLTTLLYFGIGMAIHAFFRMEHRAAIDPLLHIFNRQYCTQILAEQSHISTIPPFTIAMIDIDHFKKVNDTHGHQAGDLVLFSVAQTLQRELSPAGVVCRYGGEEIAVFFSQKTSAAIATLVDTTRKVIQKTTVLSGGKKIRVTISAGISCRTESDQSLNDILVAADKALYRAKEGGRNQVAIGIARTTVRLNERTTRSTMAVRVSDARKTMKLPKQK